jgi:hypothetical protein
MAMLGLAGWMVNDTSVAEEIVSVVVPVRAPDVAVIMVDPFVTAVAMPLAAIVATDVADERQVATVVRSTVDMLENVPVALNCCVALAAIRELAGVSVIEVRFGTDSMITVTTSVVCPAVTVTLPTVPL